MKRVLIIVTVILLLFLYSNFTVGVSDYTAEISDLPEEFHGYRILQLSDLHNRRYPFLMLKIERESPNIVVMTGDMVSTHDADFTPFLTLAEKVAKRFPTYYIVGNHEQALPSDKYSELMQKLGDIGVHILDNQMVRIERGEDKINLFGLWFNLRYYRDKNDADTADYIVRAQTLNQILGAAPEGVNILLSHNPICFDAYAGWGADLTLCGHMHGGMIRIPGFGGLLSPEKEYFPEFDAGKFANEDSTMIVSRGLGEHTGFRILNRPEIVVVNLQKKG